MMINLASNVHNFVFWAHQYYFDGQSWTTMNTKQKENKQEYKTLYFDNTSQLWKLILVQLRIPPKVNIRDDNKVLIDLLWLSFLHFLGVYYSLLFFLPVLLGIKPN